MSFTKAKNDLKKKGLEDRILTFNVSSATVKDAAIAIGCEEDEIAKSLSFLIEDKPILIIVSGSSKIDNSKYKQEFHTKAKMIPFEQVEVLIGHAAGGVCPFGINEGIDVYMDESLKNHKIIYPACGDAKSAVKLSLGELEQASHPLKWVDVCKRPE
ncbi:MAG: YbaK/EbsC family protein [Bacilli bacterium]|nr:YbaK/EbsC family protein [Bacilli bacterium]